MGNAGNILSVAILIVTALATSPAASQPASNNNVVAPGPGRLMTLVTDKGDFQQIFDTLAGARAAANGNSYNRSLKDGSEIVALNSRCEGKVSYALFAPKPEILADIKSYMATVATSPASRETLRPFVSAVLAKLNADGFGLTGACNAIPVEIVLNNGQAVRLELDDVGVPLVGTRINSTTVFEGTRLGRVAAAAKFGVTELDQGVVNGFTDGRAAIAAASKLAGTEIAVVFNNIIYLYRADPKLFDLKSDEDRVAALKVATPNPGFFILGIVSGSGTETKVLRVAPGG